MDDLTPYAGTSGWRGSEASRARAVHDDEAGITHDRHEKLMAVFQGFRYEGATWYEVGDITGWHHGEVSGALSRAHRVGAVYRLLEQRGRGGKKSHVYVLPPFVSSRPYTPYRSRSAPKLARDVLEFLEDDDVEGAILFLKEFLSAPAIVSPRRRIIPRK